METAYAGINLALEPQVRVRASVTAPTGSGSRDPRVVLNETAHRLHDGPLAAFAQSGTYDTYDGQNRAGEPDWYALEFGAATTFNCIELTMGLPYRDGGWWTSLTVQVQPVGGTWITAPACTITPPYNFNDARDERRPFETYALTFQDVTATAVRIIGRPGGLAQFTSIARIAVYHRDLSRWNPLGLPESPVPHIVRVLPPSMVWDLSEHLVKLTNLTITSPMLEYYLDQQRYERLWSRLRRLYEGEPDLWFLVGDVVGWDLWSRQEITYLPSAPRGTNTPYIYLFLHNALASAVAPIVIDGDVLGELTTSYVLVKETIDWSWHQQYARAHNVAWPEYRAAIERTPQMTVEQLEGVAGLLGMTANTIANLAHRNAALERELAGNTHQICERRALMHQAVEFMQANLEAPIDISDVARKVAMSPSYFCAVFSAYMGRTPKDFLIALRLTRAKEYLAQTQMSALEVAVAVQYDPAYFSRLFKARVGATPGEYAKRMRVK